MIIYKKIKFAYVDSKEQGILINFFRIIVNLFY